MQLVKNVCGTFNSYNDTFIVIAVRIVYNLRAVRNMLITTIIGIVKHIR